MYPLKKGRLTYADFDLSCVVWMDWNEVHLNHLKLVMVNGEHKCCVDRGIYQDEHMPSPWGKRERIFLWLRTPAELPSAVQENIRHLRRGSFFKHNWPVLKNTSVVPIRHQNRPECQVGIKVCC